MVDNGEARLRAKKGGLKGDKVGRLHTGHTKLRGAEDPAVYQNRVVL